jgi:hypothetical protein
VVASAASHLIGNVIPGLEHVRDPDWPAHAGFHVLQAIGLLTGMDLIAIALALGPLRRRDRWALWTELTYVLFAQGRYFASLAVLPKGRPRGAVFHVLYACATAIFLAGLLLGLRNSLCGEKREYNKGVAPDPGSCARDIGGGSGRTGTFFCSYTARSRKDATAKGR